MYIDFFIYYKEEKIITQHYQFHSFCFFLGYLLNIILGWNIYNNPNIKYLSTKDILLFLFICFILLLADIIENVEIIQDDNNIREDETYGDDYTFIEYLIIFFVSKLKKEIYYKHQNISFLILVFIEVIKNIYFYTKKLYHKSNIISIVLGMIYSILYAIYYLYIKGLMKYKFISPYKCNYMIGIINVPIIILMYFIISFTPLGNTNNNYYYDNIFLLFKNLRNIDAKNAIVFKFYFIDY